MEQKLSRELIFDCSDGDSGKRLDRYLVEMLETDDETAVSRSYLQKLIASGNALINGEPAAKSAGVKDGDIVTLRFEEPRVLDAAPQNIPLDIVFEDDSLLVVNKPRGMVVHPAPGNEDNTLVNALLYHCGSSLSGINGVLRPGIVHRIDKDTSGLLVVAKNDAAHRSLAAQIAEHSVVRRYYAMVHGYIGEETVIDKPIGRSDRDRLKYCVTEHNSRSAYTTVIPRVWYKGFTDTTCILKTGRTHQIRVHLSYIGHPVAGDPLYGLKNTPNLGGQCLHAGVLGFIHPASGEYIQFEAPIPQYYSDFLQKLERLDS